jgi:predicted metal-dependent peptidase
MQIDKRMTAARISLLQNNPFWGSLAMYLQIEEDPTCDTMWTDGAKLGYNPKFLDVLNERETEFALAHEVSHCAYLHHLRRGNRENEAYGDACDYVVNRDLIRGGFTPMKGILHDPRFDGMFAEEIYAVLKRQKQKEQQQQGQQGQGDQGGQGQQSGQPAQDGQGQPSQGQGQSPGMGGSPGQDQHSQPGPSGAGAGSERADPGKCGEVRDGAPAHEKATIAAKEAEWNIRVRQAIAATNARYAGNIPGHLREMFDQMKKPKHDWRESFRRFIDERTRTDYSWMKPNRRLLGMGFIVPGIVPDGVNHIGFIIDTSASMDKEALARVQAEAQAALDEGSTQKITVVYADTRVTKVQSFETGDKLTFDPVGRGGTRFAPALEWYAKNEPNVSAIVYFTDLECSDFGEEPWVPVLWAAYGQANKVRELAAKVPFGEVIQLVA